MRLKFLPLIKSVVLITMLALVFTGCKKDEDNPDYVGTWVDTGTYSDGTVSFEYKEVLVLNKNSFERFQQLKNPTNNAWLNLLGFKGTLSVQQNKINFTITEAGQSSVSTITQLPTGQIEYLKSSDEDFDDFLAYLEVPATFAGEYMVSNGNEITVRSDFNGDSDFNDPGETTTYTRQ